MKTTSMPGWTLVARSISTASFIDALRQRWGAKLSTAHWMILDAGSRSNSRLSSASSSSEYSFTSTNVMGAPSRRALRVADLGHVGAGLAVVDVVLGPVVGGREDVELLEPLGDGLGPAGSVHPVTEDLAGLPLLGEPS